MFNSEEYAWKDLTIVMAGKPVTGIQAVKYAVERSAEYNYGAGDNPHSIQKGNKSYPGEIALNQSEVEALILSCKAKGVDDPTDISFDIVANYSKSITSAQVTDILRSCTITKLEKGWNQGDSKMVITLPIMILKVEFNV